MNLEDVIQRGTRASQPAANTVPTGTLYFVTAENVFERSNGTIWESVSSGGVSGGSGGSGFSSGYALTLLNPIDEYDPISIPGPAGPIGPTGAAGSSAVQVARVTLSEAQIESWSTSPIDLVAAQGADKINILIGFTIEINITVAYGDGPSMSIVYAGDTTNLLSTTPSSFLTSTGKKLMCTTPIGNVLFNYGTFDPRNKAVRLKGSSNPTSPGTGVATGVVNLAYFVAQTT